MVALIGSMGTVACADDSPPPLDSSHGGGAAGGSSPSGGSGGVSCGEPNPEVEWLMGDGELGWAGDASFSGTITLPAIQAEPIHGLVLHNDSFEGPDGTYIMFALGGIDTTSLRYVVRGLAAGTYKVGFYVDINDDHTLSNSGDWIGYYDGTVESPITAADEALSLAVTATCQEGIDFGVGLQP